MSIGRDIVPLNYYGGAALERYRQTDGQTDDMRSQYRALH